MEQPSGRAPFLVSQPRERSLGPFGGRWRCPHERGHLGIQPTVDSGGGFVRVLCSGPHWTVTEPAWTIGDPSDCPKALDRRATGSWAAQAFCPRDGLRDVNDGSGVGVGVRLPLRRLRDHRAHHWGSDARVWPWLLHRLQSVRRANAAWTGSRGSLRALQQPPEQSFSGRRLSVAASQEAILSRSNETTTGAPSARPRTWALVVLVLLGLALIVMPFAFDMFNRAPKGATMIVGFRPFMTESRLEGFQRDMSEVNAGVQQSKGSVAAYLEGVSAIGPSATVRV